MSFTDVNWLAIIVASLLTMGIGFLWYGPLFGKQWSAVMGWDDLSEEEVKAMQESATPGYIANVVGMALTAYVIAVFLTAIEDPTWLDGLGIGALGWLGLTMPPAVVNAFFIDRNMKGLWIDMGHQFVNLLAIGAVVGFWQ